MFWYSHYTEDITIDANGNNFNATFFWYATYHNRYPFINESTQVKLYFL